jgi:hypothetical protein
VKPQTKRGISKDIEEFFVKAGVMQYFLKPMAFESDHSHLLIDFSFRDSSAVFSRVNTNFTMFDEGTSIKVDSFWVATSETEKVIATAPVLLFVDKKSKEIAFRHSTVLTYPALSDLMKGKSKLILRVNGRNLTFLPTRKTRKKEDRICRSLFEG